MWLVESGRVEDVGNFKKIIFNMWFVGSGRPVEPYNMHMDKMVIEVTGSKSEARFAL